MDPTEGTGDRRSTGKAKRGKVVEQPPLVSRRSRNA